MGVIVLNSRPEASSLPSPSCSLIAPAASRASSRPARERPEDPGLLVLSEGARRVLVAPALGGSLAGFYDETPAGPVHWLRPTGQAALDSGDPLLLASFPLMPYCNRIRDGRFRFEGREWRLPMGDGALRHALHGHAWQRPWQVIEQDDAGVELAFEHEPEAGAGTAQHPGWPFRYAATQRIELGPLGLKLTLAARNLDSRPMPFGFGHHPYYPRGASTRIRTEVEAMWHSDGELLPVSLGADPAVEALARGVAVEAVPRDNNFVGWRRETVIDWPEERRRLTMRADAPLDCFVLYSPRGEAFFCAEPVSNTTDWLNLDLPEDARGGCVLAPGETIEASIVWLPERDV